MIFTPLSLQGSYIIDPEIYQDTRGSFYRFFDMEEFGKIGHVKPWAQINHSYTKNKYSLRGLHFQLPPYAEIKMIKCVVGKIFDVIVDLRKESPTFLKWEGVEISAENKQTIYIPEGFAHGFQTLSDGCEIIYHHTAVYTKSLERGIRWDDHMINVKWPFTPVNISERDQEHPILTMEFKGINC